MLSNYIEKKQTELFNKLGVIFAFSTEQFNKQKKEGVQYVSLGSGTLCPKPNVKDFITQHKAIVKAGIAEDIKDNGKHAIIKRELENYECFYLGDYSDAIEPLEDYGFTESDIKAVFNAERDNYDY